MARRATVSDKSKPKIKRGRRLWFAQLFQVVISAPVRQILLLSLILALLLWQWANIESAVRSLVNQFSWGLLFIGGGVVFLIVQIWRKRLAMFLYHWHHWLGSIAFVLAIWGIMAFFNLGGSFGRGLIGFPASDFIGVLRILGLIVVGVFFMFPRASFSVIRRFFSWISRELERKPAPVRTTSQGIQPPLRSGTHHKPVITPKPVLPTEMKESVVPSEVVITGMPLVTAEKGGGCSCASHYTSPKGPETGGAGSLEEIRTVPGSGNCRWLETTSDRYSGYVSRYRVQRS
ncbi:hypothetical protein ACFLXZ_01365 [Chloroflexota bacterium]